MLPGLTTAAIALATLAPHVAVTTTKYQISQRLEQEVDATGVGGGKQSFVIKTTSFVTVTLTDSAGGRAMRMVVDSVRGDSLPPMFPADSLKSVRGSVYTGFMDANGNVSDVKAEGKKLNGLQLEANLRDMWPRTKGKVKVGDAWTDTTTTTNAVNGGELNTRSISSYKATGTEKVAGATATRIEAAINSAIAGSQAAGGGTADIEGTGTGTGHYFLTPDGRYLGGSNQSTANLTVTIIGPQSASIPVTLKTKTDVMVLP